MNPILALLQLDLLGLAASIAIVTGASGLLLLVIYLICGGRCVVHSGTLRFRPRLPQVPGSVAHQALETLRRCRVILDATPDATDEPLDVQLKRLLDQRERTAIPVSRASDEGYHVALGLIFDERIRQISVEGWTPQHDDQHRQGEMADAAACYAFNNKAPFRGDRTDGDGQLVQVPFRWPWDGSWWKPVPHDRIRELVKAGALIVAEIERIGRQKKGEQT